MSAITSSSGQVPINDVGTGPRPATEFRSVAISLAARVSSKIKAKIWAQEYIDLGSLLSLSPSSNSYSLSLKLITRFPRLRLSFVWNLTTNHAANLTLASG